MDIPRPILSILKHQWPNIKVSLQTTPLLPYLRFTAAPGPIETHDKLNCRSKISELRNITVNALNHRKLGISIAPYSLISDVADPQILQLPLKPTDRLPSLHKLIFLGPPDTYNWDSPRCAFLHQCMDWRQLRLFEIPSLRKLEVLYPILGRLRSEYG